MLARDSCLGEVAWGRIGQQDICHTPRSEETAQFLACFQPIKTEPDFKRARDDRALEDNQTLVRVLDAFRSGVLENLPKID
ncbi:MAG: hypothetical protein OHK005_09120 [Candidatus Methylacidiphilales bacterium]